MATHAQPLNTQTKRKPRDLIGVIADCLEDIGVDHSGATELNPLTIPQEVHFHTGLGEWKERGTKPNLHVIAQVVGGKDTWWYPKPENQKGNDWIGNGTSQEQLDTIGLIANLCLIQCIVALVPFLLGAIVG